MNTAGLSLDKIPNFKVPMGFFLLAPWFGLLASATLLIYPDSVVSRWNPAMLTFVHLLTLGFAAMIMIGAMIQVLPVISNRNVPGSDHIAPWLRGFLGIGCLSLAGGFVFSQPFMFGTAIFLLSAVFLIFLGFIGTALLTAGGGGATLFCLRLAALSLLCTVLLGLMQLSTYLDLQWVEYLIKHTNDHMMFGLLGWAMLLIMGVSFQVIPMFHVAPAFPRWLTWGLPPVLFLALILAVPSKGDWYSYLLGMIICCVLLYASIALSVLFKRKRKLVDYTVRFWQFALVNLICGALLFLIHICGIRFLGLEESQFELLIGFAFGMGFVLSVILGMLQKIIPFLMYLHLQRACIEDVNAFMSLPNMKELIPTVRSKWQYRFHLATVAFFYVGFLIDALHPYWAIVTGAVMMTNFGWLLRTLLLANKIYHRSLPQKKASSV